MSEQHLWMRAGRRWENSERGVVCRQHYFFDADARLDHARKYGPKNQDGGGLRYEPTVSASTHDFSPVMAELFRRGDNQRRTRPVTPGANIQLMWPCGSRQISGRSHFCQSSSMASFSTNRSCTPSINKMFSLGMTGLVNVRFNGVVFNT